MNLRILRIGSHALPLPSYAHPGDAGLDLAARLDRREVLRRWGDSAFIMRDPGTGAPRLTLFPGARALIPCGFAFAIPDGHEGQVRPRSSCFKRGLHVALGTIDAGYRGEVLVGVWNLGDEEVEIDHGDRIAQLVIAPVARCTAVEVSALDATERGVGGFGSTGR